MRLIIAEKPSVAGQYAKALGANKRENGFYSGNGLYISWNIGHLTDLYEAQDYNEKFGKWNISDLPIIPEQFLYKVKSDKGIKAQFKILKNLLNASDVSEVINGGDAGREGELIFRLTYKLSGSKKPIKRMWLSSMEEKAIKEAFNKLEDGKKYDPLYESALGRQWADWLFGINGTRLFTCLYRDGKGIKKFGRVQSPTLNMIVQRDFEIKNFKKEKYYKAIIYITKDGKTVEAISERLPSKEEGFNIINGLNNKEAEVVDLKVEDGTTGTPKLFNLSVAQQEASLLFGYTSAKTLNLIQALYEDYKLVTYPRTDSQYLTDDMGETALKVLRGIETKLPFLKVKNENPDIKKLLDSSKVSDHHAIIPTEEGISKDINSLGLSDEQKNIYYMIAEKFIEALGTKEIFQKTKIVFKANNLNFEAKGKRILDSGFKANNLAFKSFIKADKEEVDPNADNDEQDLPKLNIHEKCLINKTRLKECETQPPKKFNEASILVALENAGADEITDEAERKGLGTSATRAEIIEKLVRDGYIVREKKNLVSTEQGAYLVSLLPEKIKTPTLTAEWENKLVEISKGKYFLNNFITEIKDELKALIKDYEGKEAQIIKTEIEYEKVGTCPECHGDLVKKHSRNGDFIGCINFPKCRYIQRDENEKPKDYGLGVCATCGKPLKPSKYSKEGWCPDCYYKNKK